MGRTPCCVKVGLKKGSWTPEEDHKLVSYIEQHGHGGWSGLPSKAGLQRCGKSCRLRWTNYMRPDIKRGKFNAEEEQTITRLHALLGNRWSAIANHLPQRTDNEIKNYWNTHIKKRLIKMGIDPISHRRRIAHFGVNIANLSHMTQWENTRLEAESRLMRDAKKLVSGPNQLVQNKISAHQLIHKPNLSRLIPPQPLCLDVLKAWQGIMSSNFSNPITLESPISTLSFSNNSPTVPNVGFLDNQGMSMVNYVAGKFDEGGIIEQNVQNYSKIVDYSSLIPQMIQEKMENSSGLHEMVYPNGVPIIKEDFTTELIDVANAYTFSTENRNVDMDLDVNWNNLLNNLTNSSPLDSICFLN